jgi:hypothetical protein
LDCGGDASCCFLPILTCFALDRFWNPATTTTASNKNNISSFEDNNNKYIPLDVYLEIEQASTTSSSKQQSK